MGNKDQLKEELKALKGQLKEKEHVIKKKDRTIKGLQKQITRVGAKPKKHPKGQTPPPDTSAPEPSNEAPHEPPAGEDPQILQAPASAPAFTGGTGSFYKPFAAFDDGDEPDDAEEEDDDPEVAAEAALEFSTRSLVEDADSIAESAWKTRPQGAMITPSTFEPSAADNSPPDATLELQFLHGYRGQDSRDNLFFTADQRIVYSAAALGVVMDPESRAQTFFGGHNDDIISLDIHPSRSIVATGQIGRYPSIKIWNTDGETLASLDGFHKRGVIALSFSSNGKHLLSVGLDNNYTVALWDWQKGIVLASANGSSQKIFCSAMNPHSGQMVTGGVKHISFWETSRGGIKKKKGLFGSAGKIDTILSIAFTSDGDTLASTAKGRIYRFHERKLVNTVDAHSGPCFALFCADGLILSGGKDGKVCAFSEDFEKLKEFDVSNVTPDGNIPAVRALDYANGFILVGTRDCEVYKVAYESQDASVLVQGHAKGELWGLAAHPSKDEYATCSDDKTVRRWDISSRTMIKLRRLESAARSVDYSPDGARLAIGFLDGSAKVIDAESLEDVHTITDRKEEIGDIKFSPDGSRLAVGSHDNFVDVYDASSFEKISTCSGHSSYITHLDWSSDGKFLQTNSGDYEHLFWEAESGNQITKSSEMTDVQWHTWTCTLGWAVPGIWPAGSDKTDVNSVARAHSGVSLATADDFGMVKLFRFPAISENPKTCRKYLGHSSHVTRVAFSADDRFVLSAGGNDQCVMVWKHEAAGMEDASNEAEEVDPDVEALKVQSCKSVVNRPSALPNKRVAFYKKIARKAEADDDDDDEGGVVLAGQDNPALVPDKRLTLAFVHGYRGHDARKNVFHTSEGKVVYHTAGLGIVYDPVSHTQKYFESHTDDIISMALHPNRKIAATGEVGRKPKIFVWDVETLEVLAELKGIHRRGVCALGFSENGNSLVSVGLDNEHTVCVYNWCSGRLEGKNKGSADTVLLSQYSPYDPQLVTCGEKHINFWTTKHGKLSKKRGVFGKLGSIQTQLSLAFAPGGITFSGCVDGDIYKWSGNKLVDSIKRPHKGPVYAMTATETHLYSGGKDGMLNIFNLETMELEKSIDISAVTPDGKTSSVRAIDVFGESIVVGTRTCEVMKLENRDADPVVLTRGHARGELWGLATHPSEAMYATASDDNTVRVWDVESCKMIKVARFKSDLRCAAYSPDGSLLAVGLKKGHVYVLDANTLEEKATVSDRKEEISDVKFSPDGTCLAVGSHDNFVDVYRIGNGGSDLDRISVCKGHSSFITHLDWSADSKFIQTNSGDYELLYWEAATGEQQTRSSEFADVEWVTWTGVLGKPVTGIWPKGSDRTDVNAVDRSHDGAFLVTADDFGGVKLFRYPVDKKRAQSRLYRGHSSHVTCVRFVHDDKFVLSVGGADQSIFQWEYVDDDGGTGIDEAEDVDSDVEAEISREYTLRSAASRGH